MEWDVIVVGAGAAGLLASARAAQRGRRTLLVEKNRKLGVKILMSGGTRCNITHHTDARGIVEAFGRNGRFLHSALASLSPSGVVELMNQLGVATKVESTGKVFPVSDRALDVRDALVRYAEQSGVEIVAGRAVRAMRQTEQGFAIETDAGGIASAKLIVTTGGQSYPGCGTTGDGYTWAQQLGHSIVAPRPALSPILVGEAWVRALSGLTLGDVELLVYPGAGSGKPLGRRRGSFLFTHFGISGPVALDLSGTITAQPDPCALRLVANFLPNRTPEEFDAAMTDAARSKGAKHVGHYLETIVPKSLARALIGIASVDPDVPLAELSRRHRRSLIDRLFRCPMPIAGMKGFEKAEVTAGGIELDEVDSRTMESKRVPGLYFAGEILDLDGPIGGFNFQSAFSTGWLAGDRI